MAFQERFFCGAKMSKIIILTGCTRGCGRALVDRFIEAGHTVVGCGRSADQIAELASLFPTPHRFDALDITDDSAVAAWANSVLEEVGTPDLLVNNAAVINRSTNLWELSTEEFDRVIDVNIKGVTNTIRHFVPAMIEQQAGVVVNFSSGWGRSTSPHVAHIVRQNLPSKDSPKHWLRNFLPAWRRFRYLPVSSIPRCCRVARRTWLRMRRLPKNGVTQRRGSF